jgi:CrcB protein
MVQYLFVGLGGALGAICRVALSRILPPFVFSVPFTILCVNVIGCFAIGVLTEIMALHWNASINARHFLIQGLLGGFTTFSAFSLEFGVLYKEGFHALAMIYAILSVVLSILFFFFGLKLVRLVS